MELLEVTLVDSDTKVTVYMTLYKLHFNAHGFKLNVCTSTCMYMCITCMYNICIILGDI